MNRFAACAVGIVEEEASMNEVNLLNTVSRFGICVKRIGSVETLSREGIEI